MAEGTHAVLGEMGVARLEPHTLRDQAARVIWARIIAGDLQPGRIYALGTIAAQLGVSVTPVREAVLDLARDGLVELARNRGFRVSEVTDADLDKIVELRRMIEVNAVRLIADRSLIASGDRLVELARATQEHAEAGQWSEWVTSDRDFHMSLLDHLGNDRMMKVVSSLRDQSRLYGLEKIAGSDQLLESNREHFLLLDAVLNGDGEQAAQIMDTHLKHARGIWAGITESDS